MDTADILKFACIDRLLYSNLKYVTFTENDTFTFYKKSEYKIQVSPTPANFASKLCEKFMGTDQEPELHCHSVQNGNHEFLF